ncbi:MAG: phosphoribosylformylglycinamidine synthase subunit PurL [Gammaproteobacteria bacterium]|nr:phosphoribosylformylglycinamidine synthase subunit PurL [Gammaproteobacteria bacterium]
MLLSSASEQETFDFITMSSESIQSLLKNYNLVLTVDEVLTIQKTILKRPPSLAELILWSIQGSEHCSYKSSRKHLKMLTTDGPNVILGAKEDAGIVEVARDVKGKRYGIVMSHESHNHPSQIVPYEGAATGVGGNVRDVCCMGAEVIALADGLRFGDINRQKTHWIYSGVVSGISGYGNPIGVPNIAGDVYFDAGYNDNCLVTVVTLGVINEDDVIHSYAPTKAQDYIFILVGKPTDNSGFGGASFASTDLTEEQQEQSKGAIQEPNAFLKRHLLKSNYALFNILKEKNLIDKVGFKDLGAGGIACASVEMAEAGGYGAEIILDTVPTSMNHLHPAIILCSETQERFMWVVPPDLVDFILQHYNDTFALPQISAGAKAAVVGKIRSDQKYIVKYQNKIIVDAIANDVTKGIMYNRPYTPITKIFNEPDLPLPQTESELEAVLLKLLAHENIASRAPIYENYDKQVQGRTIIEAGEADAGVLQPFNEEKYPEEIQQTGIALSLDQCPRYNKIDPYWGAINAVIESARNVAAVGALPQAITDCLCFGNPEKPEQMWDFTESVRGIADACKAIGLKDFPGFPLPVISGNVSLYNESKGNAIPPSPMISCLGNMPNVSRATTKHFKKAGSLIILIGERHDECGGSVYYDIYNELGANIPKPNLQTIAAEIYAVTQAIQQGLVLSAHDISDGGVAVAIAEMSFKNRIGVNIIDIQGQLSREKKCFSETGGFILEIAKEKWLECQKIFMHFNIPFFQLGETIQEPILHLLNCIHLPIEQAKTAWENGLKNKLL